MDAMGGMRRSLRASFLALAVLVSGCADTCANEIVDRVGSPNGNYDAVLFQRDCGATTGFSTQISLVPAGEDIEGSGNVFVADDSHGRAEAGSWGGPWAQIRWKSGELDVSYAAGSRIFEQNRLVSDIAVQFRPLAPNAKRPT